MERQLNAGGSPAVGMQVMSCPLCSDRTFATLKEFSDGVLVGRCSACGMIYTPVQHEAPHDIFRTATEASVKAAALPWVDQPDCHPRSANFEWYLDVVGRHRPAARTLLDVGCAHGFLGHAASRRGLDVAVVEPSTAHAEFVARTFGFEVHNAPVGEVDLGSRTFDLITLTDALEYVIDPVATVSRLARHLSETGVFFAKVPNARYFTLRNALERRGGPSEHPEVGSFSPSRRIAHYDEASLTRLCDSAGMRVIESGPALPIFGSGTGAGLKGRATRAAYGAHWRASRAEHRLFAQTGLAQAIYVIAAPVDAGDR